MGKWAGILTLGILALVVKDILTNPNGTKAASSGVATVTSPFIKAAS